MQVDGMSGSEMKNENKSLTRDAKKEKNMTLALQSQIRSSLDVLT